MSDPCPHFAFSDDGHEVSLLAWHRGFREGQRDLRCARCRRRIAAKFDGKLQNLGPANDADEAVKIEKEAARLAVEHDEWTLKFNDGWHCPFVSRNSPFACRGCQEWHLAVIIATHDEAGGK